MWKPGEVITWRGIFRECVWHAMPTIVVKDTPQEIILALIPGTDCMVEENYAKSNKNSTKRRWDFKNKDWKLQKFTWHTNRLLFVIEPEKYYSTIYFWDHNSNEFLCYYINFQLPFRRNQCSIDTLDLDLDIVIHPDFSFEWKDMDDYQKGIETGVILTEWAREIETAKMEILDRLERREYPLDNSWLNWRPDPAWSAPKLPNGWDKI
jgi:protein associated with RNAse G/E